MAEIIAMPVIFAEIGNLQPEIPEETRWEIARKIKDASTENRNYPPGLAERFKAILSAAEALKDHELPITVGNLQEQAFTTALQAYRWLEDNSLFEIGRAPKKRQIRVTAEEVRAFAGHMEIHHNRFRREGIHSNLCQGSVLLALADIGQLDDYADFLANRE